MNRFHHMACGLAMACTALLAQAQDNTPPQNVQLQQQEIAKGDPPRWHKEDVTSAEQTRTLRKEIGAALAESTNACKKGPASERQSCIREARETYKRDMDKIPQVLAENKKQ